MPHPADHICVCICTYKRPELLSKLLASLQHQVTEDLFTYSAVVVDNDILQSARDTVSALQKTSLIKIDYHMQPEQNIALTRNRAVDNACGNYIAFIDDDEFPVPEWLLNLYKTLIRYEVDAVLGPVRPHYPAETPAWLIKSGLCERPEYKTGTPMHWSSTRTGNVLLDRRMFEDPGNRFGKEYGRTGGEDIEFFRMMAGKGKKFVWCNEAPAYETVPPDRWDKKFYTQKSLRIGTLVGEKIRLRSTKSASAYALIKSAAWIAAMSLSIPFARLCQTHLYVKALSKIMYNYGLITGFLGRSIIRERNE